VIVGVPAETEKTYDSPGETMPRMKFPEVADIAAPDIA
jgi:hypothetical protein